jgi:hypothetical protein
MVNVSDLRSRKAANVQKKLKWVLPIWFSHLGIRVKKKKAVSLFFGTAVTQQLSLLHLVSYSWHVVKSVSIHLHTFICWGINVKILYNY